MDSFVVLGSSTLAPAAGMCIYWAVAAEADMHGAL